MPENDPRKPEDVLIELYIALQSDDDVAVLQAIAELNNINFSSEAVRRQLEKLSTQSDNRDIRTDAIAALGLPAQRNISSRLNKINRGERYVLLQEINQWEKDGLLQNQNAEVIRRRYDFDFTPAPRPSTAAQDAAVAQAEAKATAEGTQAAVPMERSEPEPETPRPSLLQTLTSEAAIKIYLYLGAFFVIAAATLVGAAVPELRLPILIIGTLIFGGIAIAVKKRLPQPSFALFIVFSFLLAITANNIEESLRTEFNTTDFFSAIYWVVVYFLLALIWGASTWLYESRLFSITAFGALTLSLLRIGDLFETQAETYTVLAGVAAIAGLGAVWLVKKWRDEKFALPLFLAAQAVQGTTLIASISIFGVNIVEPSTPPLWHLGTFVVWGFACAFFILANMLYPFFAFPWLAAGTLIAMPWFLAAAFDLETLGSTIVMFGWGALLAIISEALHRFEVTRKYSLPVLLASIPAFGLGVITGFNHETWLGLFVSLGIAIIYTALHSLRIRWWLWTMALLNFIFAYFAFFQLDFMQTFDIFSGYQVVGISILFLLSDLLLKKDWKVNLEWRLPPRILGTVFTAYAALNLLFQNEPGDVAICYAVYTIFFAIYALAYRNPLLGYMPAATLPLAILFALDAYNIDGWLPVLTALAVFYFLVGLAIRAKEGWSFLLRNSALILGTLVSLAALVTTKETGGWYALVIGLLFIAEMYLRRNGWFEIGAPILFSVGAFLILRDLNFERVTYHMLAYSIVWILADLLAHLTFTHPRPLSAIVRSIGGLFTLASYGFLMTESDSSFAAFGFGIYTLLFLIVSLLYRQPNLFYTFTLTLPLFVTFLFRIFDITQWIHPVIVIAMLYYAAGFVLRTMKRAEGWDLSLLYSGLGLGVFVSLAAPALGGLDAAIPVAVAATLWAVEAFAKRSAWLAFPANGLYLLSYFIILGELNVDEPQYYSIGAALLGLIQHYLLVRAESRSGAFIMGMISQFVLLGTSYIQMFSELNYFFVLFVQSLVMLTYGIVIRSRSMTLFPIGFVVLGVFTATFKLTGVGVLFVVGCTGILLLGFGITAVLLRERISKLGERLGDWKP